MPDRTPAETLTAAADRLDALLAEAVVDGPWEYRDRRDDPETFPWQVWAPKAKFHAGTGFAPGTARYIAAMNPTVGRALAALLRAEAFLLTQNPANVYAEVFLLARAILGEAEGGPA